MVISIFNIFYFSDGILIFDFCNQLLIIKQKIDVNYFPNLKYITMVLVKSLLLLATGIEKEPYSNWSTYAQMLVGFNFRLLSQHLGAYSSLY